MAGLEPRRRARARHRRVQRQPHAAVQHAYRRLGRRAARAPRHSARGAARRACDSSGVCAEARLAACDVPIAGIAGDQQAALFGQACHSPGLGEEHLRHRLLPAAEHRARGGRVEEQPADDRRLAARRQRRLRARGQRVHRRRGRAMAARRPRAHPLGRRDRGARRVGSRQRRRLPGAGVRRPRRAALGRLRARRDLRPHARQRRRPPRARGAGGDRVPERRRARRDGEGRRHHAARAARRRRRDGQQPADAIPGRPPRRAGRAARRCSRPRRSAPATWPGSRSVTGRTLPTSPPTGRSTGCFEPAMHARSRSSGAARRPLAQGCRAVEGLGRERWRHGSRWRECRSGVSRERELATESAFTTPLRGAA